MSILSSIANSPVFKAIKFAASAVVGIPTAMVAGAVVGTAYLATAAVRTTTAHFRKVFGGGSALVFDPVTTSLMNFFGKSFKSIWTDWGLHPYRQTLSSLGKHWNEMQAELGYGNAQDEGSTVENRDAVAGPDAVQARIQQEVEKQDKISLAKKTTPSGSIKPSFWQRMISHTHGHTH